MNAALTKESLTIAADNYEESINQVRRVVARRHQAFARAAA